MAPPPGPTWGTKALVDPPPQPAERLRFDMVIGEHDEEGTLDAEQLVMGVGRLKGAARTGGGAPCCPPAVIHSCYGHSCYIFGKVETPPFEKMEFTWKFTY